MMPMRSVTENVQRKPRQQWVQLVIRRSKPVVCMPRSDLCYLITRCTYYRRGLCHQNSTLDAGSGLSEDLNISRP